MKNVLWRHPVACTLSVGAAVAYFLGVVFAGEGRAEMSALMHTPFAPIRYVMELFKVSVGPLLGVFFQEPEVDAIFGGLSGFLGIVLYWGAGRGVEVMWERIFRPADTPPR